LPRAEKEERVHGIAQRLTAAQGAVLTDYRGLTVLEAAELREALNQADTRFSVVKNSLTLLAMQEAGLEGLKEYVDGPTAIAFIHGDPVAAAKALVDQARRLPAIEIRGGYAEGRVLGADEIRVLATLDSREVMLSKVAGLAKTQVARAAWMFQALQSRFAGLMEALKEKLPQEADEARDEPDAEEAPEQPTDEPGPPDESVAEPVEEAEAPPGEGIAQGEGRARAPSEGEAEDLPPHEEEEGGG
jgi:large subunit ribosomal protein L10